MATHRIANMIKDPKILDEFFKLEEHDLLKLSTAMKYFGKFRGKIMCHPYDLIQVPIGVYGPEGRKNKNTFTTTIGKYWFNKVFIEKDLFDLFNGWFGDPVNDDTLGDISDRLSFALLEDKIELRVLKEFLMKCQKFQPYSNVISTGFSEKMLTISSKLDVKKKALLKKYEKEIAAGDEIISAKIEKEILDEAKKLLEGDPSLDMYGSGARGSFKNNFKNIFVFKVASKDPEPGKGYNIITSNYIDGVSKDDYVKVARSLAEGPYKRGKKTALGGWWEKLVLRAYQHLVIGPPGSDCGTKRYVEVTLTKKNYTMFMYNYVIEGNKLIELTYDEMMKRIGKTVKMRFSAVCEMGGNQFCSKCLGESLYRIGIHNIGTATPQLMSRVKNISMKAFHDSQIKIHEIDVEAMFADSI